MSKNNPLKKYTFYLKDVIWSTIAVVLMNVVLQFVLYPVLRNVLGAERYGDVLYLLGIMNIASIAIGNSSSMARIKASTYHLDNSRDYSKILTCAYFVVLPVAIVTYCSAGIELQFDYIFLYWVLICATAYRYYASVEYRLTTNYRGFFIYHLAISAGYLIGIFLFYLTHNWILLFLTGELAGNFLSLSQTRKKRKADKRKPSNLKGVFTSVLLLSGAQLLVNLVSNADRLMLKIFVNSTSVTIYYVSSLIGKTIALITEPINNVLIGHLAKKEGYMKSKTFLKIVGGILGCAFLITGVCVIGSHIFVYLFYPYEYEQAKELFILANLAQVMYFASGVVCTILLRYVKEKFQLYLNIFYASAFVLIGLPATIWGGIRAFSVSLCVVNTLRVLFGVVIGYTELRRKEISANETQSGSTCK